MKFYYNGKKQPSEAYDTASGCLIIIAFSAIIYVITLLDSIEDLQEYWFQLLLVFLTGGGLLFGMFKKKGELHTYRIAFSEKELQMHKFKARIKELTLDIYQKNDSFALYHLWDSSENIALFSVYEDELSEYFKKSFPTQVNNHITDKITADGPFVKVSASNRVFSYNLDSGHYHITQAEKTLANTTPKAYAYDGRYKKERPPLKKK